MGVKIPTKYEQPGFSEVIRLEKWSPAVDLGTVHYAQGSEIYVLDGEFADESGTYGAGCWLRFPLDSKHHPRSAGGCTLYIKRSGLTYLSGVE